MLAFQAPGRGKLLLCNVLLHPYIIGIFSTPGPSVSSLPDQGKTRRPR